MPVSTIDRIEEKTGELLPPEGHDRVGERIFEILDEILQDKSDLGLPEKWNRNYELSRNKHWKRKTNKATLVSANLLFNHRQRTVNMLTDNNPTFNIAKVGAEEIEDDDIYQKVLKTAEHWWIDQEQQDVLESSVTNGEENGATVEHIIFNPDLEYGIGEVETELISLFNFGVYPVDGSTNIQKKEAVLRFEVKSVREVKRDYPEFKDKIKPDSEYLAKLGDNKKEISAYSSGKSQGYLATLSSIVKRIINDAGTVGDQDALPVLLVDCWCKDYTEETIEIEEVVDGEPIVVQVTQPKYKGYIRRIITCNGGELVLEDKSNPSINPNLPDELAIKTYLYDKFPFTITPSVKDTSSIWGMCDYEQLEQLNLEINKALSQITLIKDKAARLKILNPKNSGIANEEFTNYPGILNPADERVAQAIRYMDMPNIPADLYKVVEIYKDLFYAVSGAFEIERAQTPGRDVIAYKAIAALLERASTMLKGKLRNYGKMIRERGRMYISHVQNWYTEDRWITYNDDNGDEQALKIRGADMIFPAKITVVSGSTMPRAQVQEREEAIALAGAGHIDTEELLKKLDWPDRKTVLRRLQAGPLSDLFEKLAEMGVPQELVGFFQEISQLDEKEFERELKAGKIPSFSQIIKALVEGGMPQEPQASPVEIAKIQQDNAKIEIERSKAKADNYKKLVDAELAQEKIVTERVDQIVKATGIQFDQDKLDLMRAQFLQDIRTKKTDAGIKATDLLVKASQSRGQGPFREKGLKSNNQRI